MHVTFFFCFLLISTMHRSIAFPGDPDEGLTVPQLIVSRNYDYESHSITTKDGYILTAHRIVNPRCAGRRLKPVILHHGFLMSGATFLINSAGGHPDEDLSVIGNNLGFELAKRGYDVWLANSRGNRYSSAHVSLSSQTRKFWDFSSDEMAKYDLPAVIDHVLHVTNSRTIAYVGHSQGTTIMFSLLSTQAKYNKIVKPFVALSPVTAPGQIIAPIRLVTLVKPLLRVLEKIGGPFVLGKQPIRVILERLCAIPFVDFICEHVIYLAYGGLNGPQVNRTRMSVYVGHYLEGTPTKNFVHWTQGMISGRFAKYDYGWDKNLEVYGSESAPRYKIEKITNRNIVLVSAKNDWIAPPEAVDTLRRQLRVPLLMDHVISDPFFNHADFLWAKDAGKYVNSFVLKVLYQVA